MYRLLADVFNDAAMLLDCASPLLSEGGVAAFGAGVGQAVKVSVLASSSVLRALCGVAAGSAKGCLSAHFARRGNLGEVGAKDAAQETVVSLLGTLVGTGVVSYVTGAWATWVALGLLLVGHLACNWAAVRSVTLRSLNRQRAGLVYCELVERGKLLGPEEVSGRERIFERTDVLRWKGSVVGYVLFGATVVEMLGNSGKKDRASGAYHDVSPSLDELQGVFHKERYIMSWNDGNRRVVVVLKRQANNSDKLKAWVNALIVAKLYAARAGQSGHVGHSKRASRLQLLEEALEQTSALFTENVLTSLGDTGWDLQIAALELKPASTIA